MYWTTMPPPRKAKKGAAVPKAKPTPGSSSSAPTTDNTSKPETDDSIDDALERFPLELRWCLQQLEQTMEKKKSNPKEAEDLLKSYKTLAGKKAPLVKKRLLMRSLFGDYRQKMAEEEKKFKIGPPALKTQSAPPNKSRFHKHKTISENEQPVDDEQEDTSVVTVENIDEKEETSTEERNPEVSKKLNFNSGNTFKFNFTVPS